MPNHVENHVNIRGPAEEIARLSSICLRAGTHMSLDADDGNTVFDFRALIPVNDAGIETSGYPFAAENARIEAWGTKWIGYDASMEVPEPGWAELRFTTAWSYPEPVYRALGTNFPALLFDIAATDPGNWAILGCVVGQVAVFDRQADMHVVAERVLKTAGREAAPPDT